MVATRRNAATFLTPLLFCLTTTAPGCTRSPSPVVSTTGTRIALDPQITSVVTGWGWEEGGRRGFFRLVVTHAGFEHVASDVHLQWIADPSGSEEAPTLVAERAIHEIGDRFWSAGHPTFDRQEGVPTFRFEASHTYSGEEITVVVTPTSVGHYEFSRTSAPRSR